MTPPCRVRDLGRVPFAVVHSMMLELLARIHRDKAPGEVWLVEHDPVFTAGRATPKGDIQGEIQAVERGGKITYHGPGQLVVYPIVRLPKRDVRRWLKNLEQFGVAICSELDLQGVPTVDGTGVFVGGQKIASIGVAIRHWISFHGISINIAMDLSPFHTVRPCGLDPSIMTDLSTVAGRAISLGEAKALAQKCLPILFDQGDPVDSKG